MIIVFLILALASSQSHLSQKNETQIGLEDKAVKKQDEEILDEQEYEDKLIPIVTESAKGWNLKVGPVLTKPIEESYPARFAHYYYNPEDVPEWRDASTIVINPKGEEFNIGETMYPDKKPTILWIIEIKEINERFLVIYMCPFASAPLITTFLRIGEGDRPSLVANIRSHAEYDKDITAERVVEDYFVDMDGDGIRELEDWFIHGMSGHGYIMYHSFDGKVFQPRYFEWYGNKEGEEGYGEFLWRVKVTYPSDIVNMIFGR